MTIKNKVKELWKLCFDDTEEFIELYFRLRYSNKKNVFIQNDDQIIASLQMLSYPMTFYGAEINTSYISGACTHPEHRGQGVMRRLLSLCLEEMTRRGVCVSTLIPAEPWLFGYYEKIGYVPAFHSVEKAFKLRKTNDLPVPESIRVKRSCDFDETCYAYFNRKMRERSCCIQHDSDDYRIILEDLRLSGGTLFTAWEKDEIRGMAFVIPEKGILKVNEILADTPGIENLLIRKAADHFRMKSISVTVPAGANGNPVGMARIIYAKAVLQLYAAAHPHQVMNIQLTDNELPLNNGYYYVANGKCTTTRKKYPGSHLQLSIGELARLLFAPAEPFMSLMLN